MADMTEWVAVVVPDNLGYHGKADYSGFEYGSGYTGAVSTLYYLDYNDGWHDEPNGRRVLLIQGRTAYHYGYGRKDPSGHMGNGDDLIEGILKHVADFGEIHLFQDSCSEEEVRQTAKWAATILEKAQTRSRMQINIWPCDCQVQVNKIDGKAALQVPQEAIRGEYKIYYDPRVQIKIIKCGHAGYEARQLFEQLIGKGKAKAK